MINNTKVKVQVYENLSELRVLLQQFQQQIRSDSAYKAWVARDPEDNEAVAANDDRSEAAWLWSQIMYQEGQESKSTLRRPGLIAASEDSMKLAQTLNEQKLVFKESMKALNEQFKQQSLDRVFADFELEAYQYRSPVHLKAMENMRLSRINLLQAYREIVVLERRPSSVGFTLASKSRVVQQITREQAIKKLQALGEHPEIQAQLNIAESLHPDIRLAVARPVQPHWRANLVFTFPDGSSQKMQRKAHTPLLFPAKAGDDLPDFNPIPKTPYQETRPRRSRSQKKLKETPLLAAIDVYEYALGDE